LFKDAGGWFMEGQEKVSCCDLLMIVITLPITAIGALITVAVPIMVSPIRIAARDWSQNHRQ
jgi:hypothetical protein